MDVAMLMLTQFFAHLCTGHPNVLFIGPYVHMYKQSCVMSLGTHG